MLSVGDGTADAALFVGPQPARAQGVGSSAISRSLAGELTRCMVWLSSARLGLALAERSTAVCVS